MTLPNARTFPTTAIVSELTVFRRGGGFVFRIRRRGKDPVDHWISLPEAGNLGAALQNPDSFGPEVNAMMEPHSLIAPEKTE